MPAKTTPTKIPAKGGWSKGTSGNPAGRPAGSRNKSTLFFEGLLTGEAEALIQKAIELAMNGDTVALRLCLERICPPRKERTIDLSLPEITDPKRISAALPSIFTAVGEGLITPGEAESLARVVETQIRVIEVEDLARRVAELEKGHQVIPETVDQASQDRANLDWVSRNYEKREPDSGAEAESES